MELLIICILVILVTGIVFLLDQIGQLVKEIKKLNEFRELDEKLYKNEVRLKRHYYNLYIHNKKG